MRDVRIKGNGMANKVLGAVIVALAVSGALGGITLYTKVEVTSATLQEYRRQQEDIRAEIKSMRDEIRIELRELRNSLDNRKGR